MVVVPGAGAGAPAADDDEAADVADPIDPSAAFERRAVAVPEALHGARVDRLLVDMAGEFSRSHLQRLVEAGLARVDGAVVRTPSKKVRAGQTVAIELRPTAESRAFVPQALPLAIVHEDEHLLVVDKAAGMVVHPAAGNWSGTLLNALLARHAAAAGLPRAGIVHRLDKETSGLMVVGKTLLAVTALSRAIAAREVRREYLAIAHGKVAPGNFTVEAPVGRDPRSRVRMAVVRSGKWARTDVEVTAVEAGFSLLRCRLHSGRTHQIRVHLAARGHPLVGDALYGGTPALGMSRQALHAARLAFLHPVSSDPLAFTALPPADFAAAWSSVDAGMPSARRDRAPEGDAVGSLQSADREALAGPR